jgi:hypothetical protein
VTRSGLVAAILVCCANPVGAADWRLQPSINSWLEFTDNPRLVPGTDESHAGARGELAADLVLQTEVTSLSFVPRFVYAQYPDDPLLDRNDRYATLAVRRLFETVSWSGSASYTRDTTITSEFGLTGLQSVNREHEAISVAIAPTWQMSERVQAGAQAYALDTTYENAARTGLLDYTYGLAAISAAYTLSETLSSGLELSVGELKVPQAERRSRDIDASLSLDWQLAEHWNAHVAYGPTRIESDSGDSQGHIYSVSLAKQNVRSSLSLALGRDVTPTGRGVLVTRDQLSLSSTYALTQLTTLILTGRAIRTSDAIETAGFSSQTNEFFSLESSLRWRCAEHWTLVFAAATRHVEYGQRSDDADGFNVSIGLAWSGQPRTISR